MKLIVKRKKEEEEESLGKNLQEMSFELLKKFLPIVRYRTNKLLAFEKN